ncbi:MAG: c-type cytochrome [Candidatus Promineifilaceae bacterium]
MFQKATCSIALIMLLAVILSACGGEPAETVVPNETETPVLPTTAPTVDIRRYSQLDLSGGDPQQGLNVAIAFQCKGCHDSVRPQKGPRFAATDDLPPILERGAMRIADPSYEGQASSDLEYLLESIFVSEAYSVPGEWSVDMPTDYAERIEDEELIHLMAWLETFSEQTSEQTAVPPTAPPADTTSAIDLAMDLPAGDPLVGELVALNYRCTGCHENTVYPDEEGPEFSATADRPSILERSEQRITDPDYTGHATSGQEYLVESIIDPNAYLVPGDFRKVMPATFHEELTAQDLADLLAWMATFSEGAEPGTTSDVSE